MGFFCHFNGLCVVRYIFFRENPRPGCPAHLSKTHASSFCAFSFERTRAPSPRAFSQNKKRGSFDPRQLVEKVSFLCERHPNPLPRRGRGLLAALARRSCLGGLRPPGTPLSLENTKFRLYIQTETRVFRPALKMPEPDHFMESTSALVSRAISSSSLVGTTHTSTLLSGAEIFWSFP